MPWNYARHIGSGAIYRYHQIDVSQDSGAFLALNGIHVNIGWDCIIIGRGRQALVLRDGHYFAQIRVQDPVTGVITWNLGVGYGREFVEKNLISVSPAVGLGAISWIPWGILG